VSALQVVHVRVNDAATGKPTPCRIRFTDAEGRYYPPLGRLAEFATGRNQEVGGNVLIGGKAHAYIDGACEIPLPAGEIHVEIHKGPEYTPLRQTITLSPGKLALRFNLERWSDLRADGWRCGDVRCHFLSPHAGALEGAAEDLDVVNLLALECRTPGPFHRDYPAIPNLLAFSGQQPALESTDCLVVVNTYNAHPELGSLGLLNCHRPVFPLRFGGPDGFDDWTLADWCDQCRRKGGLVVWANPTHETGAFRYGEPLADLVLGKVDAFEIDSFEDSPYDALADWYALLNCGFRIPPAGGSGKDGNGLLLGVMRTYARLTPGEDFTYRNWIEAVRAGRTFITNGPLLSFSAEDGGSGAVRVRAEACGALPFDRLEIVADGKVVAGAPAAGLPCRATVSTDIAPLSIRWVAARCIAEHQILNRPANQRVFAHSAPVYLDRATTRPDGAAAEAFLKELESMQDWAARHARCDDRQRQRLAAVFESAKQELLRRLSS
jgi:hypothetical protein